MEFAREEGELVLEVLGRLEHVVEDIHDVFALVALVAVVRAGAVGDLVDGHAVDVPRRARHLDGFLGGVVRACGDPVDDEHALRLGAVEALVVGLRGVGAEAAESLFLLLVFLGGVCRLLLLDASRARLVRRFVV